VAHAKLKRGALIRWIIDYEYFAAPAHSGGVEPYEPIYMYGVIMEVSNIDHKSVAVACVQDGRWVFLNMIHDEFEILSGE
tara:strand:+ start:7740 stop:7979 length:240 start_codon:yes stop_codon:yes gene_type:complete